MNRVSSCLSHYSARVEECTSSNRDLLKTAAKITLSAAGFFGGGFIPHQTAEGVVMGLSGVALFQSILFHVSRIPRSWKQVTTGALFSAFTAGKAYSQGNEPYLLLSLMGGMGVVYGDLILDFCCGIRCPEGMYDAPEENGQSSEEPLRGDGVMYDVNDPY